MRDYQVSHDNHSGQTRRQGLWQHLSAAVLALLVLVAGSSVAEAQTQPRAYVANRCNNRVSVIDTATNTLSTTITGVACPAGIAITPQASRVPLNIEECKNGGWRTFGPPAGPFRNQGECVSYVKNRSKNR